MSRSGYSDDLQPLTVKLTGQRKVKGDDGGCFAAALAAARRFTAFMVQIYTQGLALKMAQAERCIRRFKFAALTVHDGCLYEVSDFRGPFPQFELCRDARGEPVCGGRR